MSQLTPMLKQYLGIKDQYPDAILFFRMGDFYEMFFDDAQTASKILEITLTSRGTHQGQRVPMCGIPHHSAESYITKLIKNGLKVAICEQTGDPRKSKGIVEREVVRVITPGSVLENGGLDSRTNLFMASVCVENKNFGLAHVDLSTGEFRVTELQQWNTLLDELGRINPAEVLVPDDDAFYGNRGLELYRLERLNGEFFESERATQRLKEQFCVKSLKGFGLDGMQQAIAAAGAMVHYLQETQKGIPDHIKEVVTYHLDDYMFLDESTTRNLELFRTLRRNTTEGSLFHILNKTVTPMGSRLLKRWMGYPLLDLDRVRFRLAAVSNFKDDRILREEIRDQLAEIYDLERLNGRVALGRANARDLVALKTSIYKLPIIKDKLSGCPSDLLSDTAGRMDCLQDVANLIDRAIVDDPPVSLREGGMIKKGTSRKLDELVGVAREGKSWIAELAVSEQERTGIPKLKIGFNRVFGYYIEVTKSNLHLVPPDYIRKQTLANAERYVTESLKTYEEKVLGAEEKRVELEYEIFEQIRGQVAQENQRIKLTAGIIAEIDVLGGLAETAETNGYSCPEINNEDAIDITDGRHPVVEKTVKGEDFVPNDIHLDHSEQQLMVITGPNMAGKSTVLRQAALTVLMAQIGSFVPASRAVIGSVDRIFTRIGASDDLARGHSTFMVEMTETANILRHATPKSLVILDEIGRGTSTYDGLSIAWAVAEALHDRGGKGIKTMFATHYHELTELVTAKKRVKNFNIAVKEWNDRIIFLRKLVPGGTSRSYGIQVARIAGLPEDVIRRAHEILLNLEGEGTDEAGRPHLARSSQTTKEEEILQLHLFGGQDHHLRNRIRKLDISSMTPLEALIELNRIKQYVDEYK
ncbi:DNA mismatch repair protein MutS [Thermodesulfobacteriota bacterium]